MTISDSFLGRLRRLWSKKSHRNRRQRTHPHLLSFECLESRRLLVIDYDWSNATGALVITGDDNDNFLSLGTTNVGVKTYVTVQNEVFQIVWNGSDPQENAEASEVKSIKVDGKGGDDNISLHFMEGANGDTQSFGQAALVVTH